MKTKLMLLLLTVLAAAEVHACGLVTHAVMANRALHYYSLDPAAPGADLIRKHPDAFYSGAIFPDWGFVPASSGANATGSIHKDAGEAAHWTPFMKVAAAVVRAKPKPWDAATERLAVFLLGVMLHNGTDVYWHNLGCRQTTSPPDLSPLGFLQAMATADFAKNDAAKPGINTPVPPPPPGLRWAHNIGDSGGDPLCAYRYPLTFIPQAVWFPVDDLVEIYRRYDETRPVKLNVKKEQLLAAMPVMQVYINFFRNAESAPTIRAIVEEDYYPYIASWSPFLVERFEQYYFGGLEDSAITSSLRWPVLAGWFDREPSGFPRGDDLFCMSGGGATEHPTLAYAAATLPDFGSADQQKKAAAELARLSSVKPKPDASRAAPDSQGASAPGAYAYAGTSVAVSRGQRRGGDFNRDGLDDLVVGAPGTSQAGRPAAGAVAIHFGRADGRLAPADITVNAPAAYSRFGAATAVVDLNADGLDDLAVGAPSFGSAGTADNAQGRVYVYFGRKDGPGISPAPDLVLAGPHTYANFGAFLHAADCDGDGRDDLIVGSPYAGALQRQSGSVSIWLARPTAINPAVADWSAAGEQRNDGFGTAAALLLRANGKRVLVVGAPAVKRDEKQESGKIYGYELTGIGSTPIVHPKPLFTVAASDRFARFGAALATGAPRDGRTQLLAIGAPTASETEQTGFVVLLSADTLAGDHTLASLAPDLRVIGEQPFSRFGWALTFADLDGDSIDELIVSEPLRVIEKKVDSGMVYTWRGGATFPRGTVRASQATTSVPGPVRRAQFGRALTALDARNSKGRPRLAIASPFDATVAPLAGSVAIR